MWKMYAFIKTEWNVWWALIKSLCQILDIYKSLNIWAYLLLLVVMHKPYTSVKDSISSHIGQNNQYISLT